MGTRREALVGILLLCLAGAQAISLVNEMMNGFEITVARLVLPLLSALAGVYLVLRNRSWL
jgi:hypothetical protein